jgi:hypothetical protein
LQDWDIFLLFSYDLTGKRLAMFSSQSDPARWGTFPAAAVMFHRADVSSGRNEVHVIHTPEDMILPRPDTQRAKYTNQRFLTFLSKVRTGFVKDVYDRPADAVLASGFSAEARIDPSLRVIRLPERPWERWLFPDFVTKARELGLTGYNQIPTDGKRFVADTGELSLDYGRGVMKIDTPCTQGAIGFLAEKGPHELGSLQIASQTEFAAITATSLDGEPLGRSRRVLVTAVGRAENTAQGFTPPSPEQLRWTPTAWMLPGEGRLPVIVEPIQAEVRLQMPGLSRGHALDATGKRCKELECAHESGFVTLQLGTAGSIWCEIVVQ